METPNIMTAKYEEVLEAFKGNPGLENLSSPTMCVISLRNIPYVGRTEFSDIIIVYDPNNFEPMIVTERLYRRYYESDEDYKGACDNVLAYMRVMSQDEYGFTFKTPDLAKDNYGFKFKKAVTDTYFEFVRYKAEVWQCVKLHQE